MYRWKLKHVSLTAFSINVIRGQASPNGLYHSEVELRFGGDSHYKLNASHQEGTL